MPHPASVEDLERFKETARKLADDKARAEGALQNVMGELAKLGAKTLPQAKRMAVEAQRRADGDAAAFAKALERFKRKYP